MTLRLSPTTIKYFFQYRCERQVRYRMAAPGALESIPVAVVPDETDPWANAGNDYEQRIVDALAAVHQVIRPSTKQKLSLTQTIAFLRGEDGERYAHQAWLEIPPTERL